MVLRVGGAEMILMIGDVKIEITRKESNNLEDTVRRDSVAKGAWEARRAYESAAISYIAGFR